MSVTLLMCLPDMPGRVKLSAFADLIDFIEIWDQVMQDLQWMKQFGLLKWP